MIELYRERNGTHIELLPTDGSNISTVHTGLISFDSVDSLVKASPVIVVPRCGYAGHNVEFSTDKRLDELLYEFREVLDPESEFQYSSGDNWNRLLLSRLSPELACKLGQMENIWAMVKQHKDAAKVRYLWYEFPDTEHGRRIFAVNLDRYDEKIVQIALRTANYPITDEDITWLRSTLDKAQAPF